MQKKDELLTDAQELGIDEMLQECLIEGGYQDSEIKVYLYRKAIGKGQSYLDTFEEIPPIEHIAKVHGSGKYTMNIQVYKNKWIPFKTANVMIDDVYGLGSVRERVERKEESKSTDNMVTLLKEVLAQRQEPTAQNTNILELQKMQQQLLQDNFKNQLEMQNLSFQREQQLQLSDFSEEEEEEEMGVVEQLMSKYGSLIDKFLPLLLGPGGGALVETVKNSDEMKEILSDETATQEVTQQLNEKIGAKKTEKLMKKLKE